jgi:hypothetical protein
MTKSWILLSPIRYSATPYLGFYPCVIFALPLFFYHGLDQSAPFCIKTVTPGLALSPARDLDVYTLPE